ncbi:YcxB family protein [Oceanicoccus sagamiensis]|uniref:YcxB-like C-terminal domain-containing protein n=1 Tax=Oceanicoccus sagamiensis TaxID=716816 RepID=A0A1X9NH85_9GAMM|nr:YcxB family protein [Oceanicoccus sagamiensis]ARN75215.1 hypothetical protein BST96_14475 [Oceanicoccus sagamiensis]
MTEINSDNSSYYVLNREYFSECYDQSAKTDTGLKAYRKALFFFIVAGIFFMQALEAYVAWFLLCLGFVELLSVRYKRSWWIARQMFSRAAGSKVTVQIDDQGIFIHSPHKQQRMLWETINQIKATEKGFLIELNGSTSYLSRIGLDKKALDKLTEKVQPGPKQ